MTRDPFRPLWQAPEELTRPEVDHIRPIGWQATIRSKTSRFFVVRVMLPSPMVFEFQCIDKPKLPDSGLKRFLEFIFFVCSFGWSVSGRAGVISRDVGVEN